MMKGTYSKKPDDIPHGQKSCKRELDVVWEAVHGRLNDSRARSTVQEQRTWTGLSGSYLPLEASKLPKVPIPHRHTTQPLFSPDGFGILAAGGLRRDR